MPTGTYGRLPYLPAAPPAEESGSGNSGYELSNKTVSREDAIPTTPNNNKFVIINFDDGYPNQYRYARPILDKYGFKATFFEVCGWINVNDWQNIYAIQKDGMDIQAHSMTHPDFNKLSQAHAKL